MYEDNCGEGKSCVCVSAQHTIHFPIQITLNYCWKITAACARCVSQLTEDVSVVAVVSTINAIIWHCRPAEAVTILVARCYPYLKPSWLSWVNTLFSFGISPSGQWMSCELNEKATLTKILREWDRAAVWARTHPPASEHTVQIKYEHFLIPPPRLLDGFPLDAGRKYSMARSLKFGHHHRPLASTRKRPHLFITFARQP